MVHKYKIGDVVRTVSKVYRAKTATHKITLNGSVMINVLPVDTLCTLVGIIDSYKYMLISPIDNPEITYIATESDFLPAPESARILFGAE